MAKPDASTVALSAHFAHNQRCLYAYDVGDDWQHQVRLKEMTDAPVWRQLLGGARACPPEDCGGPPGYSQCMAVVAGQEKDPDLKEWLGDWKPEDWALANEQRVFDRANPPRQQRAVSSRQKPTKKETPLQYTKSFKRLFSPPGLAGIRGGGVFRAAKWPPVSTSSSSTRASQAGLMLPIFQPQNRAIESLGYG